MRKPLTYKIEKIDSEFHRELRDIAKIRIKRDKDDRPKSVRRLTMAIRRHNLWGKIKEDIIAADLKEDTEINLR